MGNVENLWAVSAVLALAGGLSVQTETRPAAGMTALPHAVLSAGSLASAAWAAARLAADAELKFVARAPAALDGDGHQFADTFAINGYKWILLDQPLLDI